MGFLRWLAEDYREWPWSTRLLLPLWFGAMPLLIVFVLIGQANSAAANITLGVMGYGFALNLLLAGIFEV